MKRHALPYRLGPLGCALTLACLSCPAASAQQAPGAADSGSQLSPGLRDLNLWAAAADQLGPASRTPRLSLLRMPRTTLGDPLGLDTSDPDAPPPDPAPAGGAPGEDFRRLQLSMGEDNPFFDFRRPGSPGGAGFYKVHTQYQFFDTGTTGCVVNCEAVRPAGLEANGLNDGPSFVSPSVALFHDLGDGTALHGFFGKDVRANQTWRDGLTEGFEYGVALQQPLLATDPSRGLFLFVEALGHWGDRDRDPGTLHSWEVVPGLHYRVNDNWWLMGGVLLPVGPSRAGSTSGQWQFTCSWQY